MKLMIQKDGVYRVSYEDLQRAGWAPKAGPAPDSAGMALTVSGTPVPLWLDDGGDSRFDPGDAVEFVGEHLAGEETWLHPHSKLNVYRLAWDRPQEARRLESVPAPADGSASEDAVPPNAAAPWIEERHLERDVLLLRFPARLAVKDTWYWAKLTQIDPRPFRRVLNLAELAVNDPEALEHFEIRVALRGWSTPYGLLPRRHKDAPPPPAHHRLEAALNDVPVGAVEWNDQESATLVIRGGELPPGTLRPGENVLTLKVPKREVGDPPQQLVDISLVNWIAVRYPRSPVVTSEQISARPPQGSDRIFTSGGEGAVIYAGERRIETRSGTGWNLGERSLAELQFAALGADEPVWVVPAGGARSPKGLEPDYPSKLGTEDPRADYLMITHRKLAEAVQPLAELHRRRGLEVELIDVEDIYDEFNHGIVDPRAIRDFIAHAYHRWREPAPRFVLLVGDASWDSKNTRVLDANYADWGYRLDEGRRFVKNTSTKYEDNARVNHRGLIPTFAFMTGQGQAASDNPFVTVDGDDIAPDLALGRLPVTEPEEVAAIVEKIRAYVEEPEVGPWRRNILWVTNEERRFQRRSDQISEVAAKRGYTSERVYPSPEEASNAEHQVRLQEAFDQGQLLIHFLGHGGRYIWRTGPPDLKKNHDLFTLEHLDQLAPTKRLPVVLSMTCFSAPFDHPKADSIGEKLLRLPDRGAVAVLAASWRNSPSEIFSRLLVEDLTRPGTLGEAVMRAKGQIRSKRLVEMYNLLGDPALPMAAPRLQVDLTPLRQGESWTLQGELSPAGGAAEPTFESFRGRGLVEWLDAEGNLMAREEIDVRGTSFSHRGAAAAEPAQVRVYVWDAERGLDGLGRASVLPPPVDGGDEIARTAAR